MASSKQTTLLLLLFLLFVHLSVQQQSLDTSNAYFSRDTLERVKNIIATKKPLYLHMKVDAPQNFTNLFFPLENYMFAVQQSTMQLLYVPPYAKLFTFRRLSQSFAFPRLTYQQHVLDMIIKNTTQILHDGTQDVVRMHAAFKHQMAQILIHALVEGNMINVKIGSAATVSYAMCMSALDFIPNEDKETIEFAHAFYCCQPEQVEEGKTAGESIECKFVSENVVLTLIHIALHLFRLFMVAILVHYVNKKLGELRAKKYMTQHVTNWYYVPPCYTAAVLPSTRPWLHDTRYWIVFTLIGFHVAIYCACVIHMVTPQSWDPEHSVIGQVIGWSFGLLAVIIINIVGLIVKSAASHAPNLNQPSIFMGDNDASFVFKKTQPSKPETPSTPTESTGSALLFGTANVVEKVLRTLLALVLAAAAGAIWFVIIWKWDMLEYESNLFRVVTVLLFLTGITFHLLWTRSKSWMHIVNIICCKHETPDNGWRDNFTVSDMPSYIRTAISTELAEKQAKEATTTNSNTDSQQTETQPSANDVIAVTVPDEDNDEDEDVAMLANSNTDKEKLDRKVRNMTNGEYVGQLLLRYIVYKGPTWALELLWLSSFFVLTYMAATVLTRAVWSTLLLFILDPVQIQLYLYIISLATTLWKFFNDLKDPYNRIKAYIHQQKDAKSLDAILKNNVKTVQMTQEQIDKKRQESIAKGETFTKPAYHVILSWNRFLDICNYVNVSYLLRAVLIRMILTLFILCVYFLGTLMFDVRSNLMVSGKSLDKNLGGGSGIVVGILASGVMPLIPKLLEFVSPVGDAMEKAVFESRMKDAIKTYEKQWYEEETDEWQSNLSSDIKPALVVLNNME